MRYWQLEIWSFKKSGVTMVFVSHSMKDVERICDRVAWIDNHFIKMIGTPKDVISNYLSSAV